ncbi:type IV pilin-like G/H family protein [Microcoleus sp. herbarium19]|uniref:type IV pilin-like G/H family protein n=1 Tax=unclassified Microcoleus TaxID=2642155 RepID=UPI002FD47148
MKAKNPSPELAKTIEIYRQSASGFLVRVLIYSSVFFPLIANPIHSELRSFLIDKGNSYSEPELEIANLNKEQQAYYAHYGEFNDSPELFSDAPEVLTSEPEQLKEFRRTSYRSNYNYRMSSLIRPLQSLYNESKSAQFESITTIAEAKNTNDRSYIGVVFAFKKNTSNQVTTNAGICVTNYHTPLPSTMPSFYNHQIICPTGTTLLSR